MWPWLVGAVAGLVVTGAHLLSRRPPSVPLPTARFVPDTAPTARPAPSRLQDPGLLALRLAALLAAALTVAWPVVPWRMGRARVLVVDGTAAVANADERADSVRQLSTGRATELVVFDTTARLAEASALGQVPTDGSLGAALVVAARRARDLGARYREVDVIVVAPLVQASWSSAVPQVVANLGVPLRFVRVAATASIDTTRLAPGALPDPATPLGAASHEALERAWAGVRVVVAPPTPADSAWARDGGTVVSWSAEPPRGAGVRGVLAGQAAALGAWEPAPLSREGRAIAWWDDGSVAAREVPLGRGCLRDVGVRLPSRGDDVLRSSFGAVVRVLARPCGWRDLRVVDPDTLTMPSVTGTMAAGHSLAGRRLWLVLVALLLGLEVWWRTRREHRK